MEIDKQKPLFLDEPTHLHASSNNNKLILEPGYSKFSQHIALYLITLQKPSNMIAKEYWKFKNYALHFQILDKHLFRQNSKNVLCCWVINNEIDRQKIL